MLLRFRIALLLVLSVVITPVMAQDFNLRVFSRDMETLKTEVFEVLAKEFTETANDANWLEYSKAMLNRASRIRDQISPLTYGTLRDTSLSVTQLFTEFYMDGKWNNYAYAIDTQLDLVGRIISYVEAQN